MKRKLIINFIVAFIVCNVTIYFTKYCITPNTKLEFYLYKIAIVLSIIFSSMWCFVIHGMEKHQMLFNTLKILEQNVDNCNDLNEAKNYLIQLNKMWKLAHHKDTIGELFYIKGILETKINILKNENN